MSNSQTINTQNDIQLISSEQIFTTNAEDIKLISNQICNCPIHSANVSNTQVFGSCLVRETPQKMTADKHNITCPPPAHTHNEVPLNLAWTSQAEVLDLSMKGKSA